MKYFYIHLPLVMAILLLSCQKSENSDTDLPLISGIFKTNSLVLNDSLSINLFFTFEELADGQINGGVRLILRGDNKLFQKKKYKSLHDLGLWQRGSDGTTLLEGEADLGFDAGIFSYSGSISTDSILSFHISSDKLNLTGEAYYVAPYLSSATGTTHKTILVPNYLGEYPLTCLEDSSPDCNNPTAVVTLNTFTTSMIIGAQYGDGMGGYDLVGNFEDIPYNLPLMFGPEADVLAGDLYVDNLDDSFIIHTHPATWNPDQYFNGYIYVMNVNVLCVGFSGGIQIEHRQ